MGHTRTTLSRKQVITTDTDEEQMDWEEMIDSTEQGGLQNDSEKVYTCNLNEVIFKQHSTCPQGPVTKPTISIIR